MHKSDLFGGKQTESVLSWFALGVVALPFIFLCFFNHPMGDDFWITSMVREYGYCEAQAMLYKTITARYSLLAITGASPLTFGNFWLYKIIPLVYLFLFWWVLVYFFQSFLSKEAKRSDIFSLSAVIAIIYLASMPGLGEGVFWFSSLVSYQVGILFSLWWLALWRRFYRSDFRSPRYAVAACVVLIILVGLNELFAMLASGLTALILGIRIFSGRKAKLEWSMLILIAMAWWFLLSAQSFGDRYMQVAEKGELTIMYAAGYSVLQVGYHVLKALLNPFFWIGILLGAGAFARLVPYALFDRKLLRKNSPLLFSIIGIAMVFVSFLTYYFIDIRLVPLRVTNVIIFIFFSGVLLTGILLLEKSGNRRFCRLRQIARQYKFLLIAALFLIGGFTKNNVSASYSALASGELYRYDQQMKQRYLLLKTCQTDTCRIPLLKDTPSMVRYSIADDDPHIAEYFRKKIVYVE